ncbi:chorismate-binding protein [Polaromonas sp.]|uniref:chorismate-binding protein n=1 Tax=Polaromonas sp. TaxID=1869339 RepID=UPI003567A790
MIALRVARSAATPAQAGQALARLEHQAGVYFGVDAGIHGLHPLQATLLTEPALALHLFGDGLEVEVLNGFGRQLLALPALASWYAGPLRGSGSSTLAAVRGFLACFAPSPDVLLLGALPFAAHQLATGARQADPLGVLFFGEQLLRRDAAGAWQALRLSFDDAAMPPQTQDAVPPLLRTTPLHAPAATPEPALAEPGDDHPPGGYADMVRRALASLQASALVSLTLSQSYRRRVQMPAIQAFERLRAANPAPASFFVHDGSGLRLFGASPDLQLVIRSGAIQSLPVCGTVARRPGATGEAESLRELLNEEVDAASLAVCTDALRNDLAPLCEPGSLRLLNRRHPMSLATVVHAVDRLEGRLRAGADAWDAIAATAAPVMVTGTPRKQALQSIDQLEASPRGWYGGLVVQVASNGDALVGTILRAASVRNGVAEVRTGGDLMADSSPEREEQESRLKTASLWRAFGLEATATGGSATEQAALPGSVRLINATDPFGSAMRDCLEGLGLHLDEAAAISVQVGLSGMPDASQQQRVAVGDAALHLLGQSGFAVQAIRPEHGRLIACRATADAPWADPDLFVTARYASLALLAGELPAGWQVWVRDDQGQPVALAHAGRRLVALLFRPDSLLSGPQALQVLRAALVYAAAGPSADSAG